MPSDLLNDKPVCVDGQPLSIEDVARAAFGRAPLVLSEDPEFRRKLTDSVETLDRLLSSGLRIYGVTTGFGDSCEVRVEPDLVQALPLNLVRFHGCGTGRFFDDAEVGATLVARLVSLSQGFSAIRPEVLELLAAFVTHGIYPQIPEEGSVGASGDLTPLSYVAAALMGERNVSHRGTIVPAKEALRAAELAPVTLQKKESLALMNGTSVMTGLACLNFARAQRLVRFGSALTALCADVLGSDVEQFDDRIFFAKPHPGQRACAAFIRDDLAYELRPKTNDATRLQDRYSIRCAPHVLGVLADTLIAQRPVIETELNSVNDNPIVDTESGRVWHGGNFYGGHICQAMDSLKTAVANLADLFDRQLALLCNPTTNNGLPTNLVKVRGPGASVHHGFKAMQIGTSALAAEAATLTMPASVFSRSTENHNQDKVSMGTIAARDCRRVLELSETAAAMHLLALCQAFDLRDGHKCFGRSHTLHAQVRALVAPNTADRAMDGDILAVMAAYREERLDIGDATLPPDARASGTGA
jgi:histidine ammonia-lyase